MRSEEKGSEGLEVMMIGVKDEVMKHRKDIETQLR